MKNATVKRVIGPVVDIHYPEGKLPEIYNAIEIQLPERKVVLATPIAETSLTIEGVRVVVDAGCFRKPVFDPRTALERLETVLEARPRVVTDGEDMPVSFSVGVTQRTD